MKKSELRQLIREQVLKETEYMSVYPQDSKIVQSTTVALDTFLRNLKTIYKISPKHMIDLTFAIDNLLEATENGVVKEGLDGKIDNSQTTKPNNKYVYLDMENDVYMIDQSKALEYLEQFDAKDVDVDMFMNDDEGWGEFEPYLEDVEQMTDEQLEEAMRQELSFYYFSDGDSI